MPGVSSRVGLGPRNQATREGSRNGHYLLRVQPWLDLSHAHIEAGDPETGLKVLRELIQMSPRVKHKTILARASAKWCG